jgi:hypothetical protein
MNKFLLDFISTTLPYNYKITKSLLILIPPLPIAFVWTGWYGHSDFILCDPRDAHFFYDLCFVRDHAFYLVT